MPRYIDADELFKCETCFHNRIGGCDTYCDHGESYRPAFSKFTIVDAEPVRHGRWVEKSLMIPFCEDDVDIIYECSCCEKVSEWASPYCPNCGAKMDEEVKDDDE